MIVPALLDAEHLSIVDDKSRLARLLARAESHQTEIETADQALLESFGFNAVSPFLAPVARCTYVADFYETPGSVVRADPVYLKPDGDHARLYPASSVHLEEDEADEMIESLNKHFAEDDFTFSRGSNQRWFMTCGPQPSPNFPLLNPAELQAWPTSHVAGRHISSFMFDHASNKGNRVWRQLMTEIQMLLYAHPVNQQRENRGLVPVNSVWFFGGSELPQKQKEEIEKESSVVLYADDAFALGLAKLLSETIFPINETAGFLPSILDNSRQVRPVVCHRGFEKAILTGDTSYAQNALNDIDRILVPAFKQLLSGKLLSIDLNTCDKQNFRLTRSGLLKFWRRFSAQEFLSEDSLHRT